MGCCQEDVWEEVWSEGGKGTVTATGEDDEVAEEEEPVPTATAAVVVGIDTMPLWLWWDTEDNEEDNSRDAIVLALGGLPVCGSRSL